MGRIRTVKPEMAQDEDLADCTIEAQLLAVRLLCQSDDEGYFKSNSKLVNANCFPLMGYTSLKIQGMLTELSSIGYIALYSGTDGKEYGQVVGFTKHQRVNRPTDSKIKEYINDLQPIIAASVSDHGGITIGREGNGREQGKEGNGIDNDFIAFELFYDLYPKKEDKADARKVWNRIKPDQALFEKIKASISGQIQSGNWSLTEKRFIPGPATYLRRERWDDEIIPRNNSNGQSGHQQSSAVGRVSEAISKRAAAREETLSGEWEVVDDPGNLLGTS